MSESDHILLHNISKNDYQSFERLYEKYWEKLYDYVIRRINSHEVSQEIVQEVFVSLWEKRNTIQINTSVASYLFAAAKYQMLNYIKACAVREKYAENFRAFSASRFDNSTEESMALSELQGQILQGMSTLPEKCKEVFLLKRVQHLSTHEIASQLNISPKTVENHMTRALKILRVSLQEFFLLFIALLIY